ncbi:hypothetical protein L596_005872 [Steinernema carpocapsae]|uniref:CCDC66 domain-containing protein n=1 Tax=Steinernema carpocapsae TaxID=34508 RepID=A0A4U8V1Y5_STECR|nr:hypothetical protein L596_005872 [Steinernema carpocapsae]
MSSTATSSNSPGESLLRRKQEQWEREKAESAVWFPFGSPGGGAPNRKPRTQLNTPEAPTPPRPTTTPIAPSSFQLPPPVSSTSDQLLATPCSQPPLTPQMASSPQQAFPYAYLPPMPVQSPTMYGPPQQFVFTQSPHGHPIPVEVIQSPQGPVLRYHPVTFPQATPPNLTVTSPNASSMTSSYTEQWTNRVPYWSNASPSDFVLATEARTHLPPIGDTPNRLSRQDENIARSTLSGSFSSLNSTRNRASSDDTDDKQHRLNEMKNAQHTYEAQIQEKKRREAEQYEVEQRQEQQRLEEARRIDRQLQKQSEEEASKGRRQSTNQADPEVYIERFRREAEMLKKAKLYRHVLQSPDAPKYEKEVFGTTDEREAARVFSEVDAIARQKKLQEEALESIKQPGSPLSTDRSRSLPPKHHPSVRDQDDRPIRPALAENNTIRNLENVSTPAFSSSSPLQRGRSVRVNGSPRTERITRRSDSAENLDKISAKPVKPKQRTPSTAPAKSSTSKAQTETPGNPKSLSRARRTASRNSLVDTPARSQPAQNKILYAYEIEADSEMVKSVDSGVGQTDIDNDNGERKGSIDSSESGEATVVERPRVPPLPLPPSRSNLLRSKEFGGSAGLIFVVVSVHFPCLQSNIRTSTDKKSQNAYCQRIHERAERVSRNRNPFHAADHCDPTTFGRIREPEPAGRGYSRMATGKIRSRVNSTSKLGMSESDLSPPRQSAFAKKIAEQSTNSIDKTNQDVSPSSLRRHFDNTTLSPGLTPSRLRLSFASLCGSENADGEKSPSVSPKPFNSFLSRTPQYRSFNMKRNKENQQKILDQLAQLRAQLKDKQKRIGQTLYAELDRSPNHDSVAV